MTMTTESAAALKKRRDLGLLFGTIGMIIFAGSLPATRLAVMELNPWFVAFGRAAIAAFIAGFYLILIGARLPQRTDWLGLLIVAGGVVIGFPLLTGLALQFVPSSHGILFVGFLPCLTAAFGIWRTGEKPRAGFWPWAILGGGAILVYALRQSGGALAEADLLLIGAMLVCALGYAEGAGLARRLGADETISWALLIALPLTLPVAILTRPSMPGAISWAAWGGLFYVALFSMFIGFLFWYRGLAWGGLARIGQVQLFQPFLALILAYGLLGEGIGIDLGLAAAIVAFAVFRARVYV